ncbi:MAG: chorismate mutase [Methanomassiliicoccaceae archaeon]|nr:chorismate mutase [Methanomassiliicoccaceae archaeon]MCL2146130.1 chorismate mutase [Methanomassiliicoccaceae archaeon]
MSLDELRSGIKETDLEILCLMKKRLDLAKEVGLCKIEKGLEIIEPSVEEAVVGRYRAFAEDNGMNPEYAEDICRILIRESVELQRSLK